MSDKPETGATGVEETPRGDESPANESTTTDPNAQDEPQTLEDAREALRVARAAVAQSKAEKSTLESTKQRVQELEREVEASRRGGSPPTADPRQAGLEAKLGRLAETYADLQVRANNGDRDAEFMLAAVEEQQSSTRELLAEVQLSRIKDDEVQEGTRAAMKKYSVHSVALAKKLYLGDRYEAEQSKITEKQRELDEDTEKRANGKVSTATVGRSRRTVEEEKMTYRQFARKVDNLLGAGKKDEADALIADIRRNPQKLVPSG